MSTKILLVEDDVHIRKIVQMVLEREQSLRRYRIEVVVASDGQEGLEKYRSEQPDLVITDLLMPKMDGFQLVEQLRAEIGEQKPILVTSAIVRDRKALRRLETQFGVKIQLKPFKPAILAAQVREMLGDVPTPTADGAESKPQVHAPRKRSAKKKEARPAWSGRAAKPVEDEDEAAGSDKAATDKATVDKPASNKAAAADKDAKAAKSSAAKAASAEEVVPEGAIRGTMEDAPVSRTILRALEEQWTGVLTLRRDKGRRRIFIQGGYPLFVQSNLREETLGQLMVQGGLIDATQHHEAFELSKKEGIHYGQALVKNGVMSEGDVMRELVGQTRIKIQNGIRWRSGDWFFVADPEVGAKVPRCTVDPVEAVFSGLKSYPELTRSLGWLEGDPARQYIHLDQRFAAYADRYKQVFGASVVDVLQPKTALGTLFVLPSREDAAVQLDCLVELGFAVVQKGTTFSPAAVEAEAESAPAVEPAPSAEPAPAPEAAVEPAATEPKVAPGAASAPGVDDSLSSIGDIPTAAGLPQVGKGDKALDSELEQALRDFVGGDFGPAKRVDEDSGSTDEAPVAEQPEVPRQPVDAPSTTLEVDSSAIVESQSTPTHNAMPIIEGRPIRTSQRVRPAPSNRPFRSMTLDELEPYREPPAEDRTEQTILPSDDPYDARSTSGAGSAPPSEEEEQARKLIEATYLGLHGKNLYQILGVQMATGGNGVEIAYTLKRKEYDLERYRGMNLGEAYGHLEEIVSALDGAYAVLSDPEKRKEYDRQFIGKEDDSRAMALRAEVFYQSGCELTKLGDHKQAAEAFGKAVELDDQPEYLVKQALSLFLAADKSPTAAVESMILVQAALEANPDFGEAHLVSAHISRALGADDEALEHLRESINAEPTDLGAMSLLAEILEQREDWTTLEEEYRRAVFLVGNRDSDVAGELWKRLTFLYCDCFDDLDRTRKSCGAALKYLPEDSELLALSQVIEE